MVKGCVSVTRTEALFLRLQQWCSFQKDISFCQECKCECCGQLIDDDVYARFPILFFAKRVSPLANYAKKIAERGARKRVVGSDSSILV
jgi:hypothetical protein